MAFASGIHGNTNPFGVSRYTYFQNDDGSAPNIGLDSYVEDNALKLIYGVGDRYNTGDYYAYNNSSYTKPSELLATLNGQKWLGRNNWRLFPAFAIGNDGTQIETWKCYYTANKGEVPEAFNNGQWYGNTGTTYEHHLKQWGDTLYYLGQYNLNPELAGKGHYVHRMLSDKGAFRLVPISFNNGQMEADDYSDWSQYQLPIVDAFNTEPWYKADLVYRGEVGDGKYNRRDDGYMKITLRDISNYFMMTQLGNNTFGFRFRITVDQSSVSGDGKSDAVPSDLGNQQIVASDRGSAVDSSSQYTFSGLPSAIYKFYIHDVGAYDANGHWNNTGASAGNQGLGGTVEHFGGGTNGGANIRGQRFALRVNSPTLTSAAGYTDWVKNP